MMDFTIEDERLRRLVKDPCFMRGYKCEFDNYLIVSEINLGQG